MHILKTAAEIIGIFIGILALAAIIVIAILSRDSANGDNPFQ